MASDQLLELMDGMTQDERRIKALDPGYVKIDERKTIDLLKFMTDMAAGVNYYNEKNEIDGDWQDFFKTDINVLIALITEFDLTTHLIQFEKLETRLQVSTGDKEALGALRDLFRFLGETTDLLAEIREKLQAGNVFNKEAKELAAIAEGFNVEIQKLTIYNNQAVDAFGAGFKVDFRGAELYSFYPDTESSSASVFGSDDEIKQRILTGLPFLTATFNSLRSKYNNFLAVTAAYFRHHDISAKEYHPHLALCITFLNLYQYLQDLINRLPGRHLDFYYQEILGLGAKQALPDSVHLVIDPAGIDRVDLKEGEELVAEIDGKAYRYALDEDLMITRAKVAELKTLFLDEHIQVKAPDHFGTDVKEVEVYKASYPAIAPGTFLKQQQGIRVWPVMGESQFELADQDRTMGDADIGILIASPVLFQTSGQRTVCLRIHFEPASFRQLLAYFKNFARLTGKLIQAVSYELLSDAFVISFTSLTAWEEVKRYSVKLNMSENNIEVKFELSAVESPIMSYNPEVHGDSYTAAYPIVRLLLNNYATHNPFSFFRKLVLERITVSVNVKGNRDLKLQNNVGNLSPDSPFQPFGPQPFVGSYLDIKNTNIFNRYTRDFCINMEWIDLPGDIGGWDSYYKEYDAGITNDSFKVKIGGLSRGKFRPAPARRQQFRLFELEYGEFGAEVLKDNTEIKDIDIKKLELSNKPLLENEKLIAEANFNEGAIRVEFASPQEAFGSRIYPQIFPDVVMHNAKRFSTKKKLPNPPYVPLVKSVQVDYTLEHSEVMLKTSKNEDSTMKVIHQYPFGYEEIYPESDRQPYHFIPDFEYNGNLFIGIRDLYPEQDLTLLFQLEDKNFSETARDPDPVVWSYMYENAWVPFQKHEVLYDTTNNFINSGIVKLRLNEDVIAGNTRMSPGLCWLRASSTGKAAVQSKMVGVYPHAATATRILDDLNDSSRFVLPANTIKALKNKIIGLSSIYQLFPSYGGTPAETGEQYNIRVSERLRHRKRLVTNRDIEEAILDEFPRILMAKSISPESAFEGQEKAPDDKIRIIIVPQEDSEIQPGNGQPKVNLATLYQIKNFIKRSITPFVDVEVENPVYEKIKIVGKIKFLFNKPSEDGFYLQQLNEDLRRYLCPWLYESSSSFKIGSQIYVAELLNFIKKRPYVDFITGFSVLHFYHWVNPDTGEVLAGINDFSRSHLNFIRGSVPEAVIIPSEEHLLTVITGDNYDEPAKAGIGNLLIADELLVYDDQLSVSEDEFPIAHDDKTSTDDNEYFSLFINHNIK